MLFQALRIGVGLLYTLLANDLTLNTKFPEPQPLPRWEQPDTSSEKPSFFDHFPNETLLNIFVWMRNQDPKGDQSYFEVMPRVDRRFREITSHPSVERQMGKRFQFVVGKANLCVIFKGELKCDGPEWRIPEDDSKQVFFHSFSPVMDRVSQISFSENQLCAVQRGMVRCFVRESHRSSGIKIFNWPQLKGVKQLSVGNSYACALLGGGEAYRGEGDPGLQAGVGPRRTEGRGTNPVPTFPHPGFQARVDSEVRCWGKDSTESEVPSSDWMWPSKVPGLPSGVTQISVGEMASCVVAQGEVFCWQNPFEKHSQNEDRSDLSLTDAANLPTQISGLEPGASQVSVAADHACAVVPGGVQCFRFQAGAEPEVHPVKGLKEGVSQVVAGDETDCALVDSGVKCWPQKGSIDSEPQFLPGLETEVSALVGAPNRACAFHRGTPWCWGENFRFPSEKIPHQGFEEKGGVENFESGEKTVDIVVGTLLRPMKLPHWKSLFRTEPMRTFKDPESIL